MPHKLQVRAFEAYARACVDLAGRVASPRFRDQLLDMAREWMWLQEQGELEAPPTVFH